jgi:PAS domain S-box-containing protein
MDKQGVARDRLHLDLLYHISRELAGHLELSEVISRTLDLIQKALNASGGSIAILDEDGQVVDAALTVGGVLHANAAKQLAPVLSLGLAGWVIANGRAALVADTQTDPRWIPSDPNQYRESASRVAPTRSAVAAPLPGREGVVGVMTLVHSDTDHFTGQDLRLLQSTAEHVGLAVENARLFAAERERRILAATLQEVARTINSSLVPDKVFALVLEQLAGVIRFDSAMMYLLEGKALRVVASRGFTHAETLSQELLQFNPKDPCWQVLRDRRPIVLDDLQSTAGWKGVQGVPETRDMRGWIGAPLLVNEQPVGLLSIHSKQQGGYRERDAEVVLAFADHAATAVVNARLYAASQQQTRTMAALAGTSRVVVSSLNLEDVLQQLLSRTVTLLEVEAGSIALVDDASGELVFRQATGPHGASVKGMRVRLGEGGAGWVGQNGRALVVPEARVDPRALTQVEKQPGFVARAVAAAPILLRGKVLGVIEVINPRRGRFTNQTLQVLDYLTGLAATAIAHAQMYEAAHAAEDRYLTLFQDSIDPILMTDLDGHITDANQRALDYTGYSREELLKLRIQALHPVHTGKLGERFSDMSPGEVRSYESKLRTRGGSQMPVELHVKRIPHGEEAWVQWIVRDIAERASLDELRADLTSMLFHDMRSPLGSILSSLHLLSESLPPDETVRSVMAIALRSARRLSRMIDSLLDLHRLEEGRAVIRKEKVSLAALAADAAEEVHPSAEGKNISLELDLPLRLPTVEADTDMLRRVIINMLENAIKYTPGGGSIRVGAQVVESSVRVTIADSGPGIPREEMHRIFEKYGRVERVGAPKGLGLGLAFCRMAVKVHGGRIWAESPPGGGAVFHFTLPLPTAGDAAQASAPEAPAAPETPAAAQA